MKYQYSVIPFRAKASNAIGHAPDDFAKSMNSAGDGWRLKQVIHLDSIFFWAIFEKKADAK